MDKVDIDKLETIPFDLSKLSNVIENEVLKKTVYGEFVKKANVIETIDSSDFIKKADYVTNIDDIKKKILNHDKYITTNDFNKFSGAIFDERLKQENLVTNNDLNTVE